MQPMEPNASEAFMFAPSVSVCIRFKTMSDYPFVTKASQAKKAS